MPKKERVKRARVKPKNVIQKVTVNVVGRGGGRKAPSGPPRPTPLQQAMQFVQAFQPPRPVEPIVAPAQLLQRLLDPINARFDLLMRQPSPAINLRQPDIFIAPPNVSINQRFPDINIQAPIFPNKERFAQGPNLGRPMDGEQHRDHNRQHVADLPDAPLVQPNAPLLLAGPMRMDDPHEDVPLNQIDPALVSEDEEEEGPRVGGESSSAASLGSNFNYEFFTLDDVNRLVVRRKPDNLSDIPSLEEVVQHFGIRIPNKQRNKENMIQLLRQRVPNFRYQ